MSDTTTLCFHTRDAVCVSEGSYTFELPPGQLQRGATRVVLASCEFPMVQWTIEPEWCRLWVSEGCHLTPEEATLHLVAYVVGEPEPVAPAALVLPVHVNPIARVRNAGCQLTVTCHHAHGLAAVVDGELRLLGSGAGDIVLNATAVEIVDSHTFRCTAPPSLIGAPKTLLVPVAPSPTALCARLNAAAIAALPPELEALRFEYDAAADRIHCEARAAVARTWVRLLQTPLLRLCGISSTPLYLGADVTATWATEPTRLWTYLQLTPGFYAPCHRSMCTGAPSDFCTELEACANRYYFPLTEGKPHLLVFTDPDGTLLSCIIPPGRYSPQSLCRLLEERMTALAPVGVSFSVHYDDEGRVSMACERLWSDGQHGAVFGVMFHHPESIDARRLGFRQQPLVGAHTYVSPCCDAPDAARLRSVVRVADIVGQTRFRVHTAPLPTLTGVFEVDGTPRVRTYVEGMPFAHGLQTGDVVRLASHRETTLLEGDFATRPTAVPLPAECTCVVGAECDDPTVLTLELPRIDGLCTAGTCVALVSAPRPWNMHFNKPHTIPPHVIGFPGRAVQWGIDGSVADDEGRLLPPFEAPYSHCLDHPDYVLMTLDESAGARLGHSYGGESKHVFCKLSLYPLFREERLLPRDTALRGDKLVQFTLSFWNPDMRTPYHFHGAHFSFSLAFVTTG